MSDSKRGRNSKGSLSAPGCVNRISNFSTTSTRSGLRYLNSIPRRLSPIRTKAAKPPQGFGADTRSPLEFSTLLAYERRLLPLPTLCASWLLNACSGRTTRHSETGQTERLGCKTPSPRRCDGRGGPEVPTWEPCSKQRAVENACREGCSSPHRIVAGRGGSKVQWDLTRIGAT